MGEDEVALVGRARNGDRAAFDELIRRTSRLVYARLYLDTGDAHLAEDLLQETLLRAFRSIHRLYDAAGFRSWLVTIAQNVQLDAGRRATRQKRTAPPLAVVTTSPPADQDLQREEVAGLVVGLPVHLSGDEGEKAAEARAFGNWLAQATALPIVFWDERFTTREAEGHLKSAGLSHQRRKDRRDRVAAQILLQSYLDAGCPGEQQIGPLEG